MGAKLIQDATLQGIADAIRSKTGATEPIKTNEMASAIREISVGGDGDCSAASVFKAQDHTLSLSLYSLNEFGSIKAEITLPKATTLASFCSPGGNTTVQDRINTTLEVLIVNCPNNVISMQTFLGANTKHRDNKLKKVTLNADTSAATVFREAFSYLQALEVIDGTPLDLSSVSSANNASSMFASCIALKEVRFKGEIRVSISAANCPWSRETIISAISCLSPDSTGMSLSLNEAAVNSAFETAAGANDGVSSAEWQELTLGKNWTITPAWTVALL